MVLSFQARVQPWLMECFGPMTANSKKHRNHRFLEEALELVQACGATKEEAHQLVDYVYGRPVGEPGQEVGGTMTTLAALCIAHGMNMHDQAERELVRINTPEMIAKIQAKEATKPEFSPLPGAYPTESDGFNHQLKIWPEHFVPMIKGNKTAELRRDDRGFQVGDRIRFREWDPVSGAYTGRAAIRAITHILRDPRFLQPGHAMLSLASPNPWQQAIDEALVVSHLSADGLDSQHALAKLIGWEIDVSLDPSISDRARALVDQGRRELQAEIDAREAAR